MAFSWCNLAAGVLLIVTQLTQHASMTVFSPRLNTSFTERFALKTPIALGPFGGGLSSVDLTACISEAGGFGFYGANTLQPSGIAEVAAGIRERTSRPFGLNLWAPNEAIDALWRAPGREEECMRLIGLAAPELLPLPPPPPVILPDFSAQADAAIAARPAALSFVFGIPDSGIIARCRAEGIAIIGTATTPDEAAAWEAAGAEMIVMTGPEAGGHRVSFLAPAEESLIGLMPLLRLAARRVRVPLLAAGGIADGAGIAAALMMGAVGVQIGTAFLASPESTIPALHKARLLDSEAGETVLTRIFTGRLARSIPNRLTELGERYPDAIAAYPVQGWLTGLLRRHELPAGRDEWISLWAGQARQLTRADPARATLERLTAELDEAFATWLPTS